MKLFRPLPLFALVAIAMLGACERHEWKDTKVLFKPHGGDHSTGHSSEGEPGKKEAEEKAH